MATTRSTFTALIDTAQAYSYTVPYEYSGAPDPTFDNSMKEFRTTKLRQQSLALQGMLLVSGAVVTKIDLNEAKARTYAMKADLGFVKSSIGEIPMELHMMRGLSDVMYRNGLSELKVENYTIKSPRILNCGNSEHKKYVIEKTNSFFGRCQYEGCTNFLRLEAQESNQDIPF